MASDPRGPGLTFGRFVVNRKLGQGAEGTVYLATDSHLARQVALKTVRIDGKPALVRDGVATLLDEARIVSTLAHPNIVPLYDAGQEGEAPYLVFEYVEGQTLAQAIAQKGKFAIPRAVEIGIALAQGLAYAHERNVMHRDLKPANIMLMPDGTPRLMDFGISSRVSDPQNGGGTLIGTPSYMAPEYIAHGHYLPASDIFSLGVVLYEMLTGEPPIRTSNARETVRRIVEDPFIVPSRRNPAVDERLDGLLMKALAKAPLERYASAGDLASALHQYLHPDEEEAGGQSAQGTLDYLLRRIRHKGYFPALASTISAVNRASRSDREPVAVLCNSILKDFALTSKLLKMVNASHLMQFGGSISTVSRAVSILGFDNVRNISMSLVLFEHMHDRANASALKDQVVSTYFSGLLARQLYARAQLEDPEQAFVCTMFHRLGKLLATFYLHDEAQVIERHVQTQGWDEDRAARVVLGISYEELGVGVGRAWNFPDEMLDSMRVVTGPLKRSPTQHSEKLRMLASLANELADVVQHAGSKGPGEGLARIVERYGAATGITERSLTAAIQASTEALARDAEVLGHGVNKSVFLQSARSLSTDKGSAGHTATAGTQGAAASAALPSSAALANGGAMAPDAGVPAQLAAPGASPETTQGRAAAQLAQTGALVSDPGLTPPDPSGAADRAPAPPGERHTALAAGVQDITNSLVGDHSLNDVLRIILETMYRAIGFQRVLLFVLDGRQQALRCRFGFGHDSDRIVQAGVSAPLSGKRDLFYAAVVMGADLCIDDLESEKVRQHVPDWYRTAIGARGLMLLPIVSKKRTLGLIYADSDTPAILRFSAEELGLLKTLRNQALLAMRQLD